MKKPDIPLLVGALQGQVRAEVQALRDLADMTEAWCRTRVDIVAALDADSPADLREAVLAHYEDEIARQAANGAVTHARSKVTETHVALIRACSVVYAGQKGVLPMKEGE